MATRNPITQMASTTRSALLRFELQMAEQSRKFGHRARERREELRARDGGWEAKVVVARMQEHGDKAINTNQLSRYESGEGPMPREARQEAFAYALKTDVADLCAGPIAERKKPKSEKSPLDALSQPDATAAAVDALRREIVATRTLLLAEIGKVQKAQAALRRRIERPAHSSSGNRK